MSDEDIDLSDIPEVTPEMFAKGIVRRGLKPLTKRQLTLRLDSDVIEWFKGQGNGYQTRMNALLRDTRPLIEINQQAISLLYKELGVVDAVRFLKQFTQGYGNYTEEREILFADKTLEDIVSEIEKRRKTKK